jgi:hypothetical protein
VSRLGRSDSVLDGYREAGSEGESLITPVRWPVKQVIALATGAKRSRFQSQDSRRWLGNLRLAVGSRNGPAGARSVSHRSGSAHAKFDEGALPVLESLAVEVAFDWLRAAGQVTLDLAGLPKFPPLPRLPGLYRYDFGLDGNRVRTPLHR